MIIYNTTYAVEISSLGAFIKFLKEAYIPGLLEGGVLSDPKLLRIIPEEPEQDVVSLALQFSAPDRTTLEEYLQGECACYQGAIQNRFGTNVLHFSTLMDVIDL